MSSLSLFYSIGSPVDAVSDPVRVPEDVGDCYAVAILAAPPSELNVFDLNVAFDVEEAGTWVERDSTDFHRSLDDAGEPVYCTVSTRMQNLAGKLVRVRVKTGDCIVACSALLDLEA